MPIQTGDLVEILPPQRQENKYGVTGSMLLLVGKIGKVVCMEYPHAKVIVPALNGGDEMAWMWNVDSLRKIAPLRVGDRVAIKNLKGVDVHLYPGISDPMLLLESTTAVVTSVATASVSSRGGCVELIRLSSPCSQFSWRREWLQLIPRPVQLIKPGEEE